jgi:DnaK suppressor protein
MDSRLDIPRFRALLERRRAELLEDDALGQEATETVELDQTRQGRLSRMDALQQQAIAAEAQRRRALQRKRIADALARLEDGEYGICLSCGEPIALGRLEIDPAATRCVRCAEKDAV